MKSNMVDIIEMKQRVAATEKKLKAATAEGELRGQRLLSLLQAVESNLSRNQNEIRTLREEQSAAKDEIQQLRNLLQATLTLTDTSSESRPSLPNVELESLFKRLNEIVANANRNFNELAGEMETQTPGPAIADEQVDLPAPKQQPKQKKKSRGKGLRKIFS